MRSATRLAVIVSFLAFILFTAERAIAQNGNGKGNPHIPKLVVDADGSHLTPLAKGFKSTAQKHRDNKRAHGNTACQDPSDSDSPGQKRKKAADCDTEDVSVINAPDRDNCPHCGSEDVTDGNNNTVGKHLKNKVTIGFSKPSQRSDKDGNPLTSWPPLALNPNRKLPQTLHDSEGNTIDPSIEDNSSNPIASKEDDPNSLSGKRGDPGSVDPHTTNVTRFHNNLLTLPLTGSDCSNFGSGKSFTAHDGNGKNVKDSKGDDITVTLPTQGFGALNPDGTCDVTRAMVAAMNKAYGKQKGDDSKKAFDADENGNCDTTDPVNPHSAAMKCGQENRTQHIEEDYVAHCAPNAEYVDGVCVKGNSGPQQFANFFRPASFTALPSSTGSLFQDNYAMMGFTLAPPEVSWGYSIDESACIDLGFTDICITLFAAKVGYDFDLAAGLRLPVQLEVSTANNGSNTTAIHDLSVLAGNSLSLNTSLTPQDFSAQQYTDFCNANGIADGLLVSDCNTFAFPEFFSSTFHDLVPAVPVDGQELVGKWTIFAGIKVVVMDITVIDIGIDSAGDLPTLGTMYAISQNPFSFGAGTAFSFLTGLGSGSVGEVAANTFLKTLKDKNLNWASFTTPFGGSTNIDGAATGRKFPFLASGLHLFADCVKATVKGSFITVKGKQKPFCTGLFLEYAGATLGIGLTLIPEANSTQIDASWTASGDGRVGGPDDPAELKFTQVVDSNGVGTGGVDVTNPPIGPIRFDDYDRTTDYANVSIDNFTYLLNNFGIELDANLEFGGILSPLPDLPSFPILDITFNLGDNGIPIPQHRGEKPIMYPQIFVQNYAASVVGSAVPATFNPILPASQNTLNPNKDALGIKPGRGPGSFSFQITNEGSVDGNFEHFQAVLPDTDPLFNFLAPGWTSTIAQSTASGPPHGLAGSAFTVTVTPLKDPSTQPRIYPVIFKIDSTEAFDNNMAAVDPSGIFRLGANDTVYVNVLPYFDPRIASAPPSSSSKASAPAQSYAETVQNHGNAQDQIRLTYSAVDFNTARCTLTTLGGAGCPYRAVPTAIQSSWNTAGGLTMLFDPPVGSPPVGNVAVLGNRNTQFSIDVPSDWAGMTDTTYTFPITVTSLIDDGVPPASNTVNITQTVIATKESMTRYIGLEIADLIAAIQNANAAGVKTAGMLPVDTHPISKMHGDALASILAGDLGGASKNLATEIKLMTAIQRMATKVAAPYGADLTARSTAILNDLTKAQASTITSN